MGQYVVSAEDREQRLLRDRRVAQGAGLLTAFTLVALALTTPVLGSFFFLGPFGLLVLLLGLVLVGGVIWVCYYALALAFIHFRRGSRQRSE
jgi:uncharacterized membrane protein